MKVNSIRKIGIIISLILGLILSVAAICLILSIFWPETNLKLLPLLSNNWLIKIFKIHANIFITGTDSLLGVNLYDISIVALFAFVCYSLFTVFKNLNKSWFLVAILLLFLGIVIFILTNIAGRSAFMASGLIISIILLTKKFKYKIPGSIGIISNILLLIGDFSVGTNLKIISVLFGIGYILLIVWIFMIANILIRLKD